MAHHAAALSQLSSAPDSPRQCEVAAHKVSGSPHCAPSPTVDLFNHHFLVTRQKSNSTPSKTNPEQVVYFLCRQLQLWEKPGRARAWSFAEITLWCSVAGPQVLLWEAEVFNRKYAWDIIPATLSRSPPCSKPQFPQLEEKKINIVLPHKGSWR